MSESNKPATIPNHLRSWSVVDDQELKNLRKVAEMATEIWRGCECDYDYRCGNCQRIVELREMAEIALKKK